MLFFVVVEIFHALSPHVVDKHLDALPAVFESSQVEGREPQTVIVVQEIEFLLSDKEVLQALPVHYIYVFHDQIQFLCLHEGLFLAVIKQVDASLEGLCEAVRGESPLGPAAQGRSN